MPSDKALITFMNKLMPEGDWRLDKQNTDTVFSTFFRDIKDAENCAQAFKEKLGVDVNYEIVRSKGKYQVKFNKKKISTEYEKRQERVAQFKSDLKQKRVGKELEAPEVRVPAILSPGGKAEGLLIREKYMLTVPQVNFVRKKQFEMAYNTKRRQAVRRQLGGINENSTLDTKKVKDKDISKAKNIILSYDSNPEIFSPNDPRIFIGDKGEAIMICAQAELGSGGYGAIFIGQNLDTGDFCVIKKFLKLEHEELFQIETKNLEDLNQLIETQSIYHKGKKQYKIMSMDLAWGQNYYDEIKEVDPEEAPDFLSRLDMFIKALEEIKDLHDKKDKLHRDIKLENIMWDSQNKVAKLVDFGFASDMESYGKVYDKRLLGTSFYTAPELWKTDQEEYEYTKETDIYAGGILGCEIFSDYDFSKHSKEMAKLHFNSLNITSGPLLAFKKLDIFTTEPKTDEEKLQKEVYVEIKNMIDVDPRNRHSIEETLENLKKTQAKLRTKSPVVTNQAQITNQAQNKEPPIKIANIKKDSMEEYVEGFVADHKRERINIDNKVIRSALNKLLRSSFDLDKKLTDTLNKKPTTMFFKKNEIKRNLALVQQLIEVIINTLNKPIISSNELYKLSATMVDLNFELNRQSLFKKLFYNKSSATRDLINHATNISADLLGLTKEYEAGLKMTETTKPNQT